MTPLRISDVAFLLTLVCIVLKRTRIRFHHNQTVARVCIRHCKYRIYKATDAILLFLLLCAYITASIITISDACYLIQTPYAFIFMFVYGSVELHAIAAGCTFVSHRLQLLNGNKEVGNFQNFTKHSSFSPSSRRIVYPSPKMVALEPFPRNGVLQLLSAVCRWASDSTKQHKYEKDI